MDEEIKKRLGLEDLPVDKEISPADAIETTVDFDFSRHLNESKEKAEIKKDDEVEPTKKKKAKKVDLQKLSINNTDPIRKEEDLRSALYGGKSAFQVAAVQSGYMAKMAPLVNKDIINILYDNLSRYEYKKTLFKVIYDKIVAISAGQMTFEEWLKSTSTEDIETFYFGLYCATFPNEGTYSFECPKCHNVETIKINHNNLIKTTDRTKIRKLIEEVRKVADKKTMKELSLVGKSETYELSDSGIIVDITTPSLWDALEVLRTVPETVIDRDEYSVTNMLYIKQMFIPAKDGSGYAPETDRQEILRIIDNLSIDDSSEIRDLVNEHLNENRITYSIKNIICHNCQNETKDAPISIENILFTLIFEKTSI